MYGMRLVICHDAECLGRRAACEAAGIIRDAIAQSGSARMILSTGASQFETLARLVEEDVEWRKVEMFHLDEYVGLDESHPASFRRYLMERFVSKVPLKAYHPVDGVPEHLEVLSEELSRRPVDLGLIGIGENGHIAFNDPPADMETDEPYIVVTLDDACRRQQVGEGWFSCVDDVPRQAVSMSCRQIMKCRAIVSAVPHEVKRTAVRNTLYAPEVTADVPATLLRTHPRWTLCLDEDSAYGLDVDRIVPFGDDVLEVERI